MYDKKRQDFTLQFLARHAAPGSSLLDLGDESELSGRMRETYRVQVTGTYDLDFEPGRMTGAGFDAVTSFEVFEHLLNPFSVLTAIEAPRLICSVPLDIWFVPPWRGPRKWDWHYHEFHDWQFDYLLEKTGWKITDSAKLIDAKTSFGIRPVLRGEWLRYFYPRYYFVAAVR